MNFQMKNNKSLYAISFDAVPVSGILVEFYKVASIFGEKGYKIYLDLGYDIKADKNNCFKPYADEIRYIPSQITLSRIEDINKIDGYNSAFIMEVLEKVVKEEMQDKAIIEKIERLSCEIKNKIIKKWKQLNVGFLVVENGTLPENVIFTKALYEAIDEYGKMEGLGKYVFWRDHDLMWWSELGKYGEEPFRVTIKPKESKYIEYFVLHDQAKCKIKKWSGIKNIHVLPNSYDFLDENECRFEKENKIRAKYGISSTDIVISRTTRIIGAKRIDRDICLVSRLSECFSGKGIDKNIYLLISGAVDEEPEETKFLKCLAKRLGVENNVIFLGSLLPAKNYTYNQKTLTVRDLLVESDVNSFLTSFNYEGYGNPPGEAISCGVPYLSSNYEIYNDVYGKYGFKGVILDINQNHDYGVTNEFVNEVSNLLLTDLHKKIAKENYKLGKRYLSYNRLNILLEELYPNFNN